MRGTDSLNLGGPGDRLHNTAREGTFRVELTYYLFVRASRVEGERFRMNDEEAIRRCQRGDSEAFRHVVEQYGRVLYGTAYLMTSDSYMAEDMVQEAFVLAWQGIGSFDIGQPLKPWLVRILVNRVLSHRRRKWVGTTQLVEGISVAGDRDPMELAEGNESRDELGRALATLSEEHKQVIILRFFNDFSVPEISAVLGCRGGTVKSRLHRALENMRQAMGGQQTVRSGGNVETERFATA